VLINAPFIGRVEKGVRDVRLCTEFVVVIRILELYSVETNAPFKRRFLGGCTFRVGRRSPAIPVKHKMLSSQQNSFWKFHVNKSIFHTKHRFRYIFHCDHLWYKLPKLASKRAVGTATLLDRVCYP